MGTLATFTKQPADVQDFDIVYTEWLDSLSDTAPGPGNVTVISDAGITVDSFFLLDGIVKVWVSGGTTGQKYKITATVVTTGGRTKQAEITVKVKET